MARGSTTRPRSSALSKVDAVDEETLEKQIDRLKRAMRSYGPPVGDGGKRSKPLLLSTATQRGVTDVLRATIAAIEARRAKEAAAKAVKPAAWAPPI